MSVVPGQPSVMHMRYFLRGALGDRHAAHPVVPGDHRLDFGEVVRPDRPTGGVAPRVELVGVEPIDRLRTGTHPIVKCLGFLKGSHSPHYDAEAARRPTYHRLILSGQMKPGYACDNDAGIYFEDNDVKRVVSTRDGAKCYYVEARGGSIAERVIEPERIS